MTEGGAVAVQADDAVTGNAELRRREERMRALERRLGRKTLEVAKDGLARSRAKKPTLLATSPLRVERLAGGAKPHRRHQKARSTRRSCRWCAGWSMRDPPRATARSPRS